MGIFRKKPDPITSRARELNSEISALEARIKKLNHQLQEGQPPRLRSTVYPNGAGGPLRAPSGQRRGTEPVFEVVPQKPLTESAETAVTPQHFNELGVRKYDVFAAWARMKKMLGRRPPGNPKLVNYLAAGSIQGLRPLRYEKRVARNRFFVLTAIVAVTLLGIFYWLDRRR
jgi:hypothetical protein